jgi:CheY-like chemotaxis protein
MDGPRKILIVAHSPTMVQLYRVVLDDRVLVFASNGAEGLELAAAHPDVDLFVLEAELPGGGGAEFVRRMRSDPGTRDVPVIVVASEGSSPSAEEAGAAAVLRKPWRPDELRRTVMEAFRAGGSALP